MGDACTHCSILNPQPLPNNLHCQRLRRKLHQRVISMLKQLIKTENSKAASIHIIKISHQINTVSNAIFERVLGFSNVQKKMAVNL